MMVKADRIPALRKFICRFSASLVLLSLFSFFHADKGLSSQAKGPLRVNPSNARYFTDGQGKAVYLTGSHTWADFQDNGLTDPPPVFRYTSFLDFLVMGNNNFFRLWTWEQAKWTNELPGEYWVHPMPYQRRGPGKALDGKPKFDLNRFNQAYFGRMRKRVIEAGKRGIYVSVMLFNGWSIEKAKGEFASNNPWKGHPFNRNNNINGIDGDPNNDDSGPEVHTLQIPAITRIQKAYVRKVIDTLNDLDNVLYEISNESHNKSSEWQYHMITYIKEYEAKKPKQHPVGMTVEWPDGDNDVLFSSPADWISPNLNGADYLHDPIDTGGKKVILLDTDHLCGICGDRSWVWKSFTRGMNPIFMDGYDGATGYETEHDFRAPQWTGIRRNMGYTLIYARKMNIGVMTPRNNLSSTGYCLAHTKSNNPEYLVYLPKGGAVTINLKEASGELSLEWFNPEDGIATPGGTIKGGDYLSFISPFQGDAVLYIYRKKGRSFSKRPYPR